MSIIEVKNISKKYTLAHQNEKYLTLRDKIGGFISHPIETARELKKLKREEFWALRDVSFNVEQGEVVGIIGANGAGKSTLLKILSQITPPTAGEIKIKGKVASLLEVGTGFHPELTGRENIFLNGAILGMAKKEIEKKFDEIVDFSGIEKFLDTPVKRYSSGMYVRLAFSVAAHMEPDILLIDEVLAVGDAEFQKKCLGKMDEATKKSGRTILFVSHNMAAVQSLCKRCVLLEGGGVKMIKETKYVIKNYLTDYSEVLLERSWLYENAPGNNSIKIKSAKIIPLGGEEKISVNTSISIEFIFWDFLSEAEINLSMCLINGDGFVVFNTFSKPAVLKNGLYIGSCQIPKNLLNDGEYSVDIFFVRESTNVIYSEKKILRFRVDDALRDAKWFGKIVGAVRPLLDWEIRKVKE